MNPKTAYVPHGSFEREKSSLYTQQLGLADQFLSRYYIIGTQCGMQLRQHSGALERKWNRQLTRFIFPVGTKCGLETRPTQREQNVFMSL